MENSNNGKFSGFFSKKLKAGKKRTYFFDVRSTKQGDFFLTITESKRRNEGDGYESHKVFLYKEDFKKFVEGLEETINYIKTELMPDYDYDAERPPFIRSEHGHEEHHSEEHTEKKEGDLDFKLPYKEERKVESKKEEHFPNSTITPTEHKDDEDMSWN